MRSTLCQAGPRGTVAEDLTTESSPYLQQRVEEDVESGNAVVHNDGQRFVCRKRETGRCVVQGVAAARSGNDNTGGGQVLQEDQPSTPGAECRGQNNVGGRGEVLAVVRAVQRGRNGKMLRAGTGGGLTFAWV